ncbi:MAG TPA: LysR substrate-binding domain-containing protein [Caulobacteraceae bacterium]|nr:LysR substrate-binding domain-containing protein [Caulobacteraceae bacterium]
MTLTQLAYFVRIAEAQSLSKAAAIVRVAQPALSRQLRNLEAELGTPLLVRHPWGVTLTAAGDVLLARARRTLAEAEAARDAVQALAGQVSGTVTVGVPTSLATSFLPALAAAVHLRYPKLRARFIDGFSALLHARTLSGELDLAILYQDRAMGPLRTSLLLTERLVLVGPPGSKVPPGPVGEMLDGRRLIIAARPNRLRLIVDQALLGSAAPDILEVDSLPATLAMVERGAGFTILPYSAVAAEAQRGAVTVSRLDEPTLSRTLVLARAMEREPTPAIAAVESEVRDLVEQMSESLAWQALAIAATR